MDWWNFTDITFLVFFILMVVIGLLLVLFIISFSVAKNRDIKRRQLISSESNTIRIYIIDFKNNSVLFFNRNSLSEKKHVTLAQFYSRFNEADLDSLKNWLYSICVENKSNEDFFEIDLVMHKHKGSYYSILKKVKYNDVDGLLHLESHLMRYTSSRNNEFDHRVKGVVSGHVSQDEMKTLIEKQKTLSGYTLCTRFFYSKAQTINIDRVDKVVVANLKDVVFGFLNKGHKPRQIISEPGNEIFLFDLYISDQEKIMRLAANIAHELKKAISINGYSETVDFAIGIVENAQYYQDFAAIIKTAQQACIYAQQYGMQTYFYTRSNKLVLSETGKYSQEITRLLKPHNLIFNYRPIVDANDGKVVGYFNHIEAPQSPFSNFMEMSKYSAKVHRNKEFFAYVSKNVITQYASEKIDKKEKLFIQVSLPDLPFVLEVLNQIPSLSQISLVLMFSERDFDDDEVDFPTAHIYLSALKRERIELALMMYDKNLLLDPKIYTDFDYFVIGSSMVKEIRNSKMTRLSIHTLVEQLLKYKKPIIANDVDGWQAIELIINSGITYLSSEVISPNNPMILPLDKKKIEKLMAMAGNFNK